MRMLEQINLQIQEAELDLGQQLLACREPYHRLCSLTQHFHFVHQSLDKITCRVGGEEFYRICESFEFQRGPQNRERDAVLHPDPEIQNKQDRISMVARTFLGNPSGILHDILAIQAYPVIVSLSCHHLIQLIC
jgi:hypothetical protein